MANTNERERSELCILRFTENGCFWGSYQPLFSLEAIESEVVKYVAEKKLMATAASLHPLSAGDLCVAQYDKKIWSRAQVQSVLTSGTFGAQAELFYIDRGSVATVPLHRLLPLPTELLQYPPLVQKFILKGLAPSKVPGIKLSWPEAVMHFVKVLAGKSDTPGVKVMAEVGPENYATLYCIAGNTEININEYLLSAQLAVPEEAAHFNQEPIPSLSETMPMPRITTTQIKKQQKSTIEKYKPSSPPKYSGVYVESPCCLDAVNSLSCSGIPPSVCRELVALGFKAPTAVQGYSWPYISAGQDLLIVAPASSGKTLAYLLPLLNLITSDALKYEDLPPTSGPLLLILVASSWQARSIHLQTQKILSWISAAKRFRCCCAYSGAEVKATHQLINGIDVMVCTPPSLLRLMNKNIAHISNLCHLVFDDANSLMEIFQPEIQSIMVAYSGILRSRGMNLPRQCVVVASTWTSSLNVLLSKYTCNATTIIASALEAAVRAGVELKVIPCECQECDQTLQSCVANAAADAVFTTTAEEAIRVQQMLQLHSWSVSSVVNKAEASLVLQMPAKSVLVLCDEALPHIEEGVLALKHIVHYSLPSSKAEFRQRLTLLYRSIKEGTKCVSTVLLTENCQQQSVFMSKLLERSGQPLPELLRRLTVKSMKDREEQQQNYDICYHLKAWGHCSLDKCGSPHKWLQPSLNLRPHPAQLPRDGSVKVKICHVSNATRLWVYLLHHSPLHKGETPVCCHDPSILVRLSLDMADYYSNPEHRQLHENPCEGSYCTYWDEEGGYHRAQVMKFSQPLGLYFHHKEQARVRLIDVGCVSIVDVNQLLTLPKHFLQIPIQVFEVFICGVKPCDKDQDWPEEAFYLSKDLLEGKVFHGGVAMSCGQTMWLDPFEQRIILEGISVTTALTSPQQQLVKAGLAEPNPDHLTQILRALGREQKQQGSASISHVVLPLGEMVEVLVSAVASPDFFYVQLLEQEQNLEDMHTVMNTDHCPVMSLAGVQEGIPCVARFSVDNRWYRGQVLLAEAHQSEVFFVDYGDTEWVPNNLVQPIDASLLQLPFQGIECSFNVEGIKWSSEAGDLLWEWTRDQVLLAKVVETYPSKMPGVTHHVIELYEPGGTNAVVQRLPKLEGGGAPSMMDTKAVHSIKKGCTSFLTEYLAALSSTTSEGDGLQIVSRMQAIVMQKPSIEVTPEDVLRICEIVSEASEAIATPLLRLLAGMAVFQKSVCEFLASSKCLQKLTSAIKGGLDGVVGLTLSLLKTVLFTTSCYKLVGSKEIISLLCGQLKSTANKKFTVHILEILAALVQDNRRLFVYLTEAGVVERICVLLTQLPSCHAPCLQLLHSLVASRHKPAVDAVKDNLPLNTLFLILDSEQKPEVIRLLVELLQKLSLDSHVKQQLCESPLLTILQQPVSSATKCLLFQQLQSALGVHLSQGRPESPPPLEITLSADVPPPLIDSEHPPSLGPPPLLDAVRKITLQSLHPRVLWSQCRPHVLLAVQLRGCKEPVVHLQSFSVQFEADLCPQRYAFELQLYAETIPETSSKKVTGREVLIKLSKKEHGLWPRLTQDKKKLPFLAVDFDRWGDSSSSDGEEGGGQWRKSGVNTGQKVYRDFLSEPDTSSSASSEEEEGSDIDQLLDFDV